MKHCMAVFPKLSLKNTWLPPILFLGYQEHLLISAFSHGFKLRKNIPVLVGTIHWKPEYLKMRRTYMCSNNSRHRP